MRIRRDAGIAGRTGCSTGATRQYSGTVGGVAVTVTYAAGRGHAPISRVIAPPRRDRDHRLHWSARRRRHQYRARQAHRRWNAYAETAP